MQTLKQILQDYVPTFTKLGDEKKELISDESIEELRGKLMKQIKGQSKRTTIYFVTFFAILIIAAIFAILANFRNDLGHVANICTITGVAPLTMFSVVTGWIKDRDNAKMLLKMLDSLNKENFENVLIAFAAMLRK